MGAVYGSRGRRDRVFEHEVVYDVALRLMARLRAQGVHVHPTLRNPHQPTPLDKLPQRNPGRAEVLVNPPYGERVGRDEALEPLYKQLGDVLKQRCTGKEAFVFTAHGPLVKAIGLRASRRDILFNGPLECRLLRFEMY